MITKYFAVRDQAAMAFLPPIPSQTKETAIRMFAQACRDQSHDFSKNAVDYSLWYIGEFDDNAGVFIPLPQPEKVLLAVEVTPA